MTGREVSRACPLTTPLLPPCGPPLLLLKPFSPRHRRTLHRLEQELNNVDEKRVIVFVNTQRQCDNVHRCVRLGPAGQCGIVPVGTHC